MVSPLDKKTADKSQQQPDGTGPQFRHSHFSEQPATLPDKKVCVVGLGYIGLPTASLLASRGYNVCGVDIREGVVRIINAGDIHIREPELDVMVRSAVESKRLKADLKPAPADVFILAVPTPFKDDHEPDLSYVETATRNIAPVLKQGDLVILESTSPVGTTEKVSAWLAEERPDLADHERDGKRNGCSGLLIAHCPERVLPGQIIRELVENDRIVGGVDEASTKAAVSFYKTFVSGEILHTDARTAEMSKLAENTFRDVNIAYANELSIICHKLSIDVWRLIQLANHHPRVNILQPGPGVGGHCIAVDPWFIASQVPDHSHLITTARRVNDSKPAFVVSRILEITRKLGASRIAVLGLSFKPDVDDLRESPAIRITQKLAVDTSLRVLAVEPHIQALPPSLSEHSNVKLVSLDQALEKADILVSLVKHTQFVQQLDGRELDMARFVDFVNLLA